MNRGQEIRNIFDAELQKMKFYLTDMDVNEARYRYIKNWLDSDEADIIGQSRDRLQDFAHKAGFKAQEIWDWHVCMIESTYKLRSDEIYKAQVKSLEADRVEYIELRAKAKALDEIMYSMTHNGCELNNNNYELTLGNDGNGFWVQYGRHHRFFSGGEFDEALRHFLAEVDTEVDTSGL